MGNASADNLPDASADSEPAASADGVDRTSAVPRKAARPTQIAHSFFNMVKEHQTKYNNENDVETLQHDEAMKLIAKGYKEGVDQKSKVDDTVFKITDDSADGVPDASADGVHDTSTDGLPYGEIVGQSELLCTKQQPGGAPYAVQHPDAMIYNMVRESDFASTMKRALNQFPCTKECAPWRLIVYHDGSSQTRSRVDGLPDASANGVPDEYGGDEDGFLWQRVPIEQFDPEELVLVARHGRVRLCSDTSDAHEEDGQTIEEQLLSLAEKDYGNVESLELETTSWFDGTRMDDFELHSYWHVDDSTLCQVVPTWDCGWSWWHWNTSTTAWRRREGRQEGRQEGQEEGQERQEGRHEEQASEDAEVRCAPPALAPRSMHSFGSLVTFAVKARF